MSIKDAAAANRKEQILESAVNLFAEQGYYKTTTAHVAHAVGVTQPYVFHFFRSKEDLYLAVLERAFHRLQAAFKQVESPPAELTQSMGRAFFDLLGTHRSETLLLMQSFTTPEAEVRAFAREKYTLLYDTVKERFSQAGIAEPAREASLFISCGLIITLSEVLELPQLIPWNDPC